jgi:hypothetical protein
VNVNTQLFHKHPLISLILISVVSFSFEEMRIRYERRDPRPEDIRRIDELKTVVDSQEQDIYHLTEQLRELQLQLQEKQQQQMQNQQNNQINQQNSNQSNKNRNRGKNNKNNRGNNNGNLNNAQQMRQNQQQQQQPQNATNDSEQQQHLENEQPPPSPPTISQQRMRPPPLIKTVIYEEENEDELYEEQLREERERQSESIPIPQHHNFTVELVPESPDNLKHNNGNLEEISEALIVHEHEIINQRVIPSPTPDDLKNQEIAVEVISTIEPSHIQIIPVENGLDLELD